MTKVSLICPCYNEEVSIVSFINSVGEVINTLPYEFEIIFIDDGSFDNTKQVVKGLASDDSRVRLISLSRNFGKEAALTAGIDHCIGDAAIPIDVDLQDPPELIPKMLEQWSNGYDVVIAKRVSRMDDSLLKRVTASLYYRTHNVVADVKIPENVGDYRLISRKVIEAVKLLPENQRFMKGIFSWVGFRTACIEYDRKARVAGNSSFNGRQLWRLAIDGFTGFSTFPIKVWFYIGLLVALSSFIYGSIIIVKTLILGVDTPGYASLMVAILFLGGVQLIALGLLGEYIGRLYLESKNRPTYIIDEIDGKS